MDSPAILVTPTTPHCGATISGVDLSRDLPEATFAEIHRALVDHGVLFLRDQALTPEQQKAFARRFGDLHRHPAYPRLLEGHPEIMVIHADEKSTRIAGEDWHSDVSCDPEPPMGTLLYMLEVPPVGGDTLFASMGAAYAALSAPVQRFLAGLTAVHDGEHVYRGRYETPSPPGAVYPRAEHPVVRTHPVSGRQVLFVNRLFTTRIVELARPESDAVLAMLFRHIETPEFHCRFRWEPGSIAFWDNRQVQHHALWDYYPHRRRGLRVTIRGDRPFHRPAGGG
jgi:taurine dioxygenase